MMLDKPKPNNKPPAPPTIPILKAMLIKIACTSEPEKPVAFRMAIESIFS